MPKSSKAHSLEKGKVRSVEASLADFALFMLLVVTQPIDFRRWENKCFWKQMHP